jgi:DUF4097 and DUF4098 domain-containing protein YvlB
MKGNRAMRITKKQTLFTAVLLIVIGIMVLSVRHVLSQGNEGGSAVMENQSYAVSDVNRILIRTDSPSVVIKSVPGDQINMTWQTDEYIEFTTELKGGKLSIDYRVSTNWLEALLQSALTRDDYLLEIELPETYAGALEVQTASGAITVNTAAALETCSLKSISGSIEAEEINSKNNIKIESTSGGVSADSMHAAGDIHVQTVSGSLLLYRSTALGNLTIQTASGKLTGADLNAAYGLDLKTISGKADLSQIHSDAYIALASTSGSIELSDVDCESISSKSVSGSVHFTNLTADGIAMGSMSGSVKGTVNGTLDDYSVQIKTISGNSNLQSGGAGREKTIKVDTISGGIDIRFSDDAGN